MSSCDDDFALLRDDAQSHHLHEHRHHHQQQQHHQQHHVHHSQPAADHLPSVASPSFVTQRFGTPPKVGGTLPLHHHQQHPHPHQHHQLHHLGPGIPSRKKSLIGGSVAEDVEDDDDDPDEDYGRAFVQTEAPKLPTQVTAAFHDVASCFGDSPSNNPFGAPTQHQQQQSPPPPPPPPPRREEGDDRDNNNSSNNNNHNNEVDHKGVGVAPVTAHHLDTTIKRRDRDELSDDGASPYCFASAGTVGGAAATSKKPRPSSTSAVMQQPSGDYRKDREEWSDSAIGCLLDAYTEKYIQLNRGNLRGRDWEEVATIVSERCDKQKSFKSVEQCKNKVDNLKKRYKAERQRLSSGNLSVSHWPWFRKMEQIVGSSSSPSVFSKPVPDDDKSATAATSGAVVGGSLPAIKQAKRYMGAAPGPASLTSNLKMKALSNPRWRRVVLKISGAAFAGNVTQNVDPKVTMLIAREIAIANRAGVEVAIVVGGRNFFVGETWVDSTGIDRATAYQIGMMATVMNSVLLQASLEKLGVQTRVQTGFMMLEVAEPYIRRRAIRHLEKGRVVIFGGIGAGTGNPLFTTDTAAALRASEINADAVLKGTDVDSVYDCHSRNSSNIAFEHITFRDSASRGFPGMDMTAITFCEENNIPVVVFNLLEPGNISKALCGEQVGTLIDQSGGIS